MKKELILINYDIEFLDVWTIKNIKKSVSRGSEVLIRSRFENDNFISIYEISSGFYFNFNDDVKKVYKNFPYKQLSKFINELNLDCVEIL